MSIARNLLGKIRPYNRIRTPTILQLSDTECGIAALAIIFSFYKLNIPIETLRDKCGSSRDGCKAVTLMKVAKEWGFNVNAFKVDLEAISTLEQPVIAFWNFNHYVVINGVGTNKVFINDPAYGQTSVTMDDFDKSFTGIILMFSPAVPIKAIRPVPITIPIIKKWLSGFRVEMIFLFLCMFVAICCTLLNSAILTILIDQCLISKKLHWLIWLGLLSIISVVIFSSSTLLLKWNQFKFCAKASVIKSSEIMAHTLQLPMLFYSLRQKSEIISILSRVEIIINQLSKSIFLCSVGFLTCFLCLILMLHIDYILTFISFITSLFSFVIIYLASKLNVSYEKANINAIGKLFAYSISCIRNIETIKACAFEEKTLQKWQNYFCKKLMIQDSSNTLKMITTSLNEFINSFSTIVVLFAAGFQVANSCLSIGNLMGFYTLHLLFFNTINSLYYTIEDSQNAYASHIRINDIMDYSKDIRFMNSKTEEINTDYKNAIICKEVCFSYNITSGMRLKPLNLCIKKGEHIAFVGQSGSGKSTLAKILCALYPPMSGEILLFGKSLNKYTPDELATILSYVSQEITLFSDTIYNNLTLWQNSISLKDINQAIENACLKEIIKNRSLYGSVEDSGNNFSGGEKQRLEIARALIQNTDILIFDEATSAMDIYLEKKIIDNLRKTNKTIVFIAHRLSTVQHCDQIFVMNNGVIVENGDHKTLLNNKKYYYTLIKNESLSADHSRHANELF